MSKSKRSSHSYPGVGVTSKLLLYFLVFLMLMLLVVWVFQVMLLNLFYRNTKMNEMEGIADMIEQSIMNGEYTSNERVLARANEYLVCIRVFRIDEKGNAVELWDAKASEPCLLHRTPSVILKDLYQKALSNDGHYQTVMPVASEPADMEKNPEHDFPDDGGRHIFTERLSMISVDVCYAGEAQTPYVIMLNSALSPLRATAATLRVQFIWIAIILAALALLMAIVFSRSIISPIVRMNQSAKLLAKGNYDVQFEGEGYRETRELAQTLNYASRELSKNDRLQKELIANVSHDLRTPLTMIKGYGEIMRDIPGENTPENMQTIIDETERLSELVNALLDISRLQADATELQKEPFDLTEQVQRSVARYDKLRAQDGYTVQFSYDSHVCVNADKTMILQVLYNLINNGINYAGEDKIVTVRQECRADKVRVSVIDHGVGIAEDQIPLIWDRYYKVDRVHKRAVVGTGLGLSIVKTVLERHGAAYGVESQIGQGSTFWFELEIDADE